MMPQPGQRDTIYVDKTLGPQEINVRMNVSNLLENAQNYTQSLHCKMKSCQRIVESRQF